MMGREVIKECDPITEQEIKDLIHHNLCERGNEEWFETIEQRIRDVNGMDPFEAFFYEPDDHDGEIFLSCIDLALAAITSQVKPDCPGAAERWSDSLAAMPLKSLVIVAFTLGEDYGRQCALEDHNITED